MEGQLTMACAHGAFLTNHFVFEENTREFIEAVYAMRPVVSQSQPSSTSITQGPVVRFNVNPQTAARQTSLNVSRNYVENTISGGLGERGTIRQVNLMGELVEDEELMPEGFFRDSYPITGPATQRYNLIIRNLSNHLCKFKTNDDFRKWWPIWRDNIHLMDESVCPYASRINYLQNLLEGEPAEEVEGRYLTGHHQVDYNRIIKALFIKHTKDQSSHLSIIAEAQALKPEGYSCIEVRKYIRSQMRNVDMIKIHDPLGKAWGNLIYESIMSNLPVEVKLILQDPMKFNCESNDYRGILEHGLAFVYKVLDKKPLDHKFLDPSFGIGETWDKFRMLMENPEKLLKMVPPIKRGPPPQPLNNASTKRTQMVPKKPEPVVNHVNEEEDIPDSIHNTAWAARVAEEYNMTETESAILFHIQDNGKWPKRKTQGASGSSKPKKCSFCLEENTHATWDCPMSMDKRHGKVRENNICRKCLRIGHQSKACTQPNRACGRCGAESHNKALCIAKMQSESFPEGGEKIKGINNKFPPKGSTARPQTGPKKDSAPVMHIQASENEDSDSGEETPSSAVEFLIP
jgi:hypothetical protein